MDLITEYLRMLSDEERDRVIEAQEWRTEALGYAGRARCMIGHAEAPNGDVGLPDAPKAWAQRALHQRRCEFALWNVGDDFDALAMRHTLPVAVRAIKAECARLNNRIPTAPPARETVGAA